MVFNAGLLASLKGFMGMNSQELKDRLEAHKEWLADSSKGKRLVLDSYANLRYADLSSANLSSADLSSANLRYADLSSANLSSADLRYADLSSANLSYANLRYANLRYADLSSANLSSADLRSANLSSADLRLIKKDFFERLLIAKNEAKGLYDYLQKGLVNGLSYEGECACFVGTVSKITKENYKNLSCGLKPDSNSPTEKWFLAILKGDTPQNSQVSKITCEWIEEFCKEQSINLPKYKIVSSDEFPACWPV